ncbi:hypothetical protein A3K69_02600 [Candidatus Bathyarchaeota archaeon RBG_16_57_9]|nr:MAG: hypothetical protein A3K69_02600 [Candidatus Bathyarchaeota archaeon RBG_16_57_9]
MANDWILGIFLVAHGWAHVWYVILSQRLIEFKEEMVWTGESWVLSGFLSESVTRLISTLGYSVSLIGFVAGGVALILGRDWWRPITLASAIISSVTVVLFWDGKLSMLKERGIIGLLIDLAVIAYVTLLVK